MRFFTLFMLIACGVIIYDLKQENKEFRKAYYEEVARANAFEYQFGLCKIMLRGPNAR